MKHKRSMDESTKKYIKKIRLLLIISMIIICILFALFARLVVFENSNNLKRVVLAEVQESLQETVNNITIHIETIRARMEDEAMIDIVDLSDRIKAGGITNLEDALSYLEVCEENQLAQAIEMIYIEDAQKAYYINAYEREVTEWSIEELENLYIEAAVCNKFQIADQELILFVHQADIDILVKEEIRNYIHSEYYEGNQYVWVNEVLNMEGGDNYAICRIHPNLVELEGEYLSTSMQDIKGNFPYKTELEGIRENGKIFHFYYFKNKTDDTIAEKYSYAQYYEPFHWIIATGETIEEVYAYSEEINKRNVHYIIGLMCVFGSLFAVMSGMMIKILGKQANRFQNQLLKQNELYEDMYTTMAVGMLRVRMTHTDSTIIKINPKGLELIGMESEDACKVHIHGHVIDTMHPEDAKNLTLACQQLKEQWTSVVEECRITWKDGSEHLLRIRNTLVDYDGEAKVIQRLFWDITEERRQQEMALIAAEEKATLDPMTQIKNKKAIETIIRTQILEAAEKNLSIAVGFVDIDNFRDYNTKYGHLQGDEVIKHVASTLKENIPGIVGRNGGDEFSFCILNADYEMVHTAMSIIHKKLNEGIVIKDTGELVPTPCSIGVVIERNTALSFDVVMEESDVAMYEAKARGKNTYHILSRI